MIKVPSRQRLQGLKSGKAPPPPEALAFLALWCTTLIHPPPQIFSQLIYTDLKNDQIWSLMGWNWNPGDALYSLQWGHTHLIFRYSFQSRAFFEESGDAQIKKIITNCHFIFWVGVILFFESAIRHYLSCMPSLIQQNLIGERFLWDQ